MTFFAYHEAERFYGGPEPAPGARVRFTPEKLLAARERGTRRPVDRHLVGDEGLLVHKVTTDVLGWPSSLWCVDDLELSIPRAGDKWTRCRAFTVVEQVPTWLVAGPHGDAVEWIITQARTLTGCSRCAAG